MRSFAIIKLNIGSNAGLKCSIGRMVLAVELFFFNDAKNDSATALSCGLPSGEKDCFVLCVHEGSVGNDERYIVRLGRYEK